MEDDEAAEIALDAMIDQAYEEGFEAGQNVASAHLQTPNPYSGGPLEETWSFGYRQGVAATWH